MEWLLHQQIRWLEDLESNNWRLLHTVGINYLAIAFLFTFIANIFQKDIYSIYTIFALAVLMIFTLKLKNKVRQ